MKFESAPQERVGRFEAEVERILHALAFCAADAAVSDEACVSDFADFGGGFTDAELQHLSADLGIAIQNDSMIADLAEALSGSCHS